MKRNSNEALEIIRSTDSVTITPAQAADVIGCDPAYIRFQARRNPEALGFPTIVYGSRIKIPRIPFLEYVAGNPATDGKGA